MKLFSILLCLYLSNDRAYKIDIAGFFCSQFLLSTWRTHFISEKRFLLLSAVHGSHPVWPRDSFGPTLTSARKYFGPKQLRPGNTSARNNFGPENTSARLYTLARKQLRPREYFGPLIYFGPEILRPDRLRPATLRPGDQTFKSVIFHHF